ncbi:unnamed protein product [Lepeophtheirus salmonis]|uniref:(salmon louse) hypothetical protein n=1 Tax=Lepeophtheirus salmonis TaxID=72036 RepID=A0A7R8CW33_LEPSM|nr:unnamed protein product [Lepeophtheirus salmonis]CAF2948831.1 unnamed protein product [Lepeophtheirus salmonis]
MGPSNQKLWKELGISKDKPFFIHPDYFKRRIFLMGYPPHLIKVVRNNLLTSGFHLPKGGTLTKELFQNVLKAQSQCDLTPLHFLKPIYINYKDHDRQRVYMATQLLSHEVFSIIRLKWPDLDEQQAVIKLMSSCSVDALNRIRLLMLGKQVEFAVPNVPVKCRITIKETQDMPPLIQLKPTSISKEEEFEHHNSEDCIS